jgi:sulfate adenylyltransferase subunit 2
MIDKSPHLRALESESISIIYEVVSQFRNPVMLYSIGKDSAVMLHLALKAFRPGRLPFSLLHVDTTWKFREMISFRDEITRRFGVDLIVHINQDGVARGIDPVHSGSALHTQVMKTDALKQALDKYGFDAAFGGARRDEEKSRAKERILSFRTANHTWEPRQQRPELWTLFNTRIRPGESIRAFPLSNWTELDIWEYIKLESIPVVPLYFAKVRPVVIRSGTLVMVDDQRLTLEPGEDVRRLKVRFRTLGCYPLTGAVESDAETLDDVIGEVRNSKVSERQGRLIDSDSHASMERKKREGYF